MNTESAQPPSSERPVKIAFLVTSAIFIALFLNQTITGIRV